MLLGRWASPSVPRLCGARYGRHLVNTLVNEGGFVWVGYGVIVTMLPLIIVGLLGLFVFA